MRCSTYDLVFDAVIAQVEEAGGAEAGDDGGADGGVFGVEEGGEVDYGDGHGCRGMNARVIRWEVVVLIRLDWSEER